MTAKQRTATALIIVLAGLCGAIWAGAPLSAAEIGDPVRGEILYRKCQSCHMVGPDARNRVGPHLNEVFGRAAAELEDYNYSKAMRRAGADGLVWTVEKLDLYIENPKSLVTGTRMAFRGLRDAEERRDLMAYLRTFSGSPRDIPESEPTASPRDPEVDAAILAIQGDPDYGAYLSSECTTCHQASGDDRGIPSIVGWPSGDFVTAMHAYKGKARPHPVMQMIAGRLSNEEIASLAAYFQELQVE
ncbi:MAG: c-type cytochrome [Alphaproteobacteria bacterium]|nr:c-type cytochrome [Alphaproteobacteria bacterium]